MKIRFFTARMYHNKNFGSTRLRAEQLLPYWPEAGLYKYGENPDAMIFQKVYLAPDWKWMAHYEGVKVLDICDPDWLDGVEIKKTLDVMDGITCPTEPLKEFLAQMTDKPIRVIPDRHDLTKFTQVAKHAGPIKSVVWFGYKHNAEVLRFAMNFLLRKNVKLTVISNEDPMCYRWAEDQEAAEQLYTYKKFDHEELNADLAQHDAALFPAGTRPKDRFKSNNKTIIAHLSGLPVITDDESFNRLNDAKVRASEALQLRRQAIDEYDIKLSVEELKEFIIELRKAKL